MPHSEENLNFSAPPEVHAFDGLLFDMDGTIIDSTAAIIKHWEQIAREIGVDPQVILASSHGRRSIDVLREYDPSRANMDDVRRMEGMLPRTYGADAVEIPGSRALLDSLEHAGARWAIVTSGTRPLVTGWLDVMKLAHPRHLVVAEDVAQGKPDPEGYRLGHRRLGLHRVAADPRSGSLAGGDDAQEDEAAGGNNAGEAPNGSAVVVFEDAPAGVRAGKAAGFKVVALATTHTVRQVRDAGADWIVRDMRSVTLKSFDKKTGKASIEISNALVD